jgi:hypothetical protein
MVRSNTASWDDEEDDNLTTFLPRKALLPVPGGQPRAREERRDRGSESARHAKLGGGPRARCPAPEPASARTGRLPLPQPGPMTSRPSILVPTVLGALGLVFTLGMLIDRFPHFAAAPPMAVAAPETVTASVETGFRSRPSKAGVDPAERYGSSSIGGVPSLR